MVKQIYSKFTKYKKSNKNSSLKIPDSVSTAKYLLIVESPSKCDKIENYLGALYCCISSKGHIQNISGLKSIDTKNHYQTKFDIIEEKKSHIDWMKKIIPKFDKSNIILATDDDREGEAIAWHICQVFDLNVETTKRILFHEITKPALLAAIENPTIINMNMVKAQQARQVLDMLVGFKISPILWKYLYRNKENSLSAGRCQTPALRLVYDNEMERKTAEIRQTYKITGSFFQKKIVFDLSKEFENNEPEVLDFLEKSKTHTHELSISSPKEIYKSPPKPFNTSNLLQSASSTLGIGPKETMSICQQLYQDGLITYMRTESQKYSGVFLKSAEKYITTKFNNDTSYIGKTEEIENTDSSNPHEAIRITNIETTTIDCENTRAISLYKLIWRNTVESCMSTAKYQNTVVQLTAPLDHHYRHTIEVPLFLGWKKISDEKKSTEDAQNTGAALLLYMKSISSGTAIPYNTITVSTAIHGKHSHYTEASLIKKLEDLGIGRPSTFAMIVDTILERGYVKKTDIEGLKIQTTEYQLLSDKEKTIQKNQTEKIFGTEKGKLAIQPVGIMVAVFLSTYFSSLFSYDYSKKMELDLDEISRVQSTEWYSVCEKCHQEIKESMKPMTKIAKEVFTIKGTDEYKLVYEKYGPVLRKVLEDGTFEYKTVKKDVQIDLGKLKNTEYHLYDLIDENPTDTIVGVYDNKEVRLKSGPYGKYIEYGNEKKSLKSLGLDESSVDPTEILSKLVGASGFSENKMMEGSQTIDKNMIRKLNDRISIKNGKYGAYIYYKTATMTKPTFYNIQKFKESYTYCSEEVLLKWIKDKYNVE